jgi:Ca2+-binding EF-hand superfamily protein
MRFMTSRRLLAAACLAVALAPPAARGQAAAGPEALPPLQASADADRNGRLDDREAETLARAVRELVSGQHGAAGALDAAFDSNHDGRLDIGEVVRARETLLEETLPRLPATAPAAARLVDLDSNGRVDSAELALALDFLWRDERLRAPHAVAGALDQRLDSNGDGRVGKEEIEAAVEELSLAVTAIAGQEPPERPAAPARTGAPQPPARPGQVERPAAPRGAGPDRPAVGGPARPPMPAGPP